MWLDINSCIFTTEPGDDLSTEVREGFHTVQNGPSSSQEHYIPAIHHFKPVKWVRFIYAVVDDQFADVED